MHYELNRSENKKSATRNSGGVIIYVRDIYTNDDIFILKSNDTHIWLKLDHKHCNFDNDLFICLCFIVPDNSSRNAIVDFNIYDILLDNLIYIKKLTNDKCNFLCLGDFNARVGNRSDFVSEENVKHMPFLPEDYITDTELPRKSQDTGVNSNGLLLLDFLKQSGLRIANGRVCGDIGSCTFVGNRGSSLVDYWIIVLLIQKYSNIFHLFMYMIQIFCQIIV